MRRKVVALTPKLLAQSGLACRTCLRWEGVSVAGGDNYRQSVKTEHLRRSVREWKECGKAIVVDGGVLAIAQYGPAELWPGARTLPSAPVSDDAVLLACLHVVPHARGRGLGRVLLQSVEAGLVRRKVRAVEVFATRGSAHGLGSVEFYLQNGFYILRDDPQTPLLRLELKALVGWQINIQFALDGLRIPTRARAGAPA